MYKHMLSPLVLGATSLKNRVIMGSIHTNLEEHKNGFERLGKYFGERAKGGVGLIITGGISPNVQGAAYPMAAKLTTKSEVNKHKLITQAVHQEGGKICMQILHMGRYSFIPFLLVAPSPLKAPINKFKPWSLTRRGVEKTIRDYVRCAELACEAGYDGVEIMGSEGYLINQFTCEQTNTRTDEWGGSFENRARFPIEIVRRTRAAIGPDKIIIYRLSLLDLVAKGNSWEQVVELGQRIEAAGATIINSGIGWHEARIPTIGTMVPRAGYAWVTKKFMGSVKIPVAAANRINAPEVADALIRDGYCDLVSMARPFLADPDFVIKAERGESHLINTCIACNQACLDHVFKMKISSCLVNPRAGNETELNITKAPNAKRIAVVGAGPAGLAFTVNAAERGHSIVLYDSDSEIGGQFLMAKKIPGKEEFTETLRYYRNMLEKYKENVSVNLKKRVTAEELISGKFDEVVLATGVTPRTVNFPVEGTNTPKIVSYVDVIKHGAPVGQRVAVVGAGGIGFDVSEFISETPNHSTSLNVEAFCEEWGIDYGFNSGARGGVKSQPKISKVRDIHLLQRSKGKVGGGLGTTTGWIHRTQLKNRQVEMWNDVEYVKADNEGFHIKHKGTPKVLPVDTIIICAGQNPLTELAGPLKAAGVSTHVVGGAEKADGLDAKRAINDATWLASKI